MWNVLPRSFRNFSISTVHVVLEVLETVSCLETAGSYGLLSFPAIFSFSFTRSKKNICPAHTGRDLGEVEARVVMV